MRVLTMLALLATTLATSVDAKDRARLGYGRLITNDLIGDGKDRWRTGSVASSRIWGPSWQDELPTGFGEILEFRLGAEVIAPADLGAPAPGDRPYAGSISVGLHTHFQRRGLEFAVGGDLVFTGPMTHLDDFQAGLHDLLGQNQPSTATRSAQIGDGVHPTLVFEVGKTMQVSDRAKFRPFVEGRAGIETMVRGGFDLTFGQVGEGELLVRDPVSGHRYRALDNVWSGYSFVLGADLAYVADSDLLPASSGVVASDTRERVRMGVHWQNDTGAASAFYGLTWLGKEFESQPDDQVVGSVRLRLDF